MVTKLDGFLTTFAARNIADDEELAALVRDAKDAMHGLDPAEIRKNEGLKDAVKGQFDALKTKMDEMVMEKPGRQFSFETEE